MRILYTVTAVGVLLAVIIVFQQNILTSTENIPIQTFQQWQDRNISEKIDRIVCSGPGALRLVVYLDCADKVIAVEDCEKIDAEKSWTVPYRVAHPELSKLPIFGSGNGRDNPELLLGLEPPPQIIIKIDTPGSGFDPMELQRRTGIPVVLVPYGDLGNNRETLNETVRFLGKILDKSDRAEKVIAFWENQIAELEKRTRDIPKEQRPTVYIGGVAYRGVHGFASTNPDYLPFQWVNANNVAAEMMSDILPLAHALIAKEQILAWNPEFLFVDRSTELLGDAGGVAELQTDTLYQSLDAVQKKNVHTLLPGTYYNINFEAQLINAWRVGKMIAPEKFSDVDPEEKANEISTFLLSKP